MFILIKELKYLEDIWIEAPINNEVNVEKPLESETAKPRRHHKALVFYKPKRGENEKRKSFRQDLKNSRTGQPLTYILN